MGACISPEEEYETRIYYFCKACHKEQFGYPKRSGKWNNTPCLICRDMLPEKYNWIDVTMRRGVCNQTCQYVLSILEKVKKRTLFDAAYNSALNKLYHYPYDAEIIFDLAIALINRATQEDVHQMKKAKYIDENDQEEIEFGKSETKNKITTTSIYLTENQSAIQLKYFNNNGQRIKPEKAHKIDTKYDFRYPGKDTLSLTKINLKITLEIPPGAMVQIASRLSLASKEINIREEVINARYTGDIIIMLQNKTDKPFRIDHAEKIAQNREQLGKSERGTQGFGSTGRFTVPVNIAFNTQNKSYQILQLPQPITISLFGEHHEIYTCSKPTTTQ
ncbi:hypothetical protein G9A89_015461 [Geosiphon pyriformis]|nr:hypothetical protein G9A89_015461 [Geosiphon pyriformis]